MQFSLNRQNFSDHLSRYTTSQLEEMVEKYPFFHQAHLLLAKKYQLEKSPRFDAQMQLAAMYAQDRELFFELFKEDVAPVFEQSTTLPVTPDAISHIEEVTSVDTVQETPVAEILQAAQLQEETVASETDTGLERLPTILEGATETHEVQQDEPVAEEITTEAEAAQTDAVTAATVVEAEAEAYQEPEQINLEVPHTFTEWLHLFSGKQSLKPQPVDEDTAKQLDDELDTLISVSARADYLHQLVEEETHYAKGLDVFIEEQKRKHRPVKEGMPEAAKAGPTGIMITETLANVYVQQKKYAKAIEAFEALTLKFPEKSGLFAARIKYINELIK